MIRWKHLFPGKILIKGQKYFLDDAVGNISSENGHFHARVYEWSTYDVEVSITDKKIENIICSCADADEGKKCAHMAAMLFRMEKDGLLKTKEENITIKDDHTENGTDDSPFSETKGGDGYRYFRIENIAKDVEINPKTYKQAEKFLSGKTEEEIRCSFGYSRMEGTSGKLLGHVGFRAKGYYFADGESAFIEFDNKGLTRKVCRNSSCPGFRYNLWDGLQESGKLCEHQAALLIWLKKYLENNNPGDATDLWAGRMLKEYKNRMIGRGATETAERREISIVPRLCTKDGGLAVSFRIGQEKKMYVVKDLPALVDAFEAREEFPLGAKLTLNFAADTFCEEGKRYFDLISRYVKDTRQRSGSFSDRENTGTRQQFLLYGSLLDDFFDTASGKDIECTCTDDRGTVHFQESEPEITLTLTPERDSYGQLEGVCLHGYVPSTLQGAKYEYFLTEDALIRADNEKMNELYPLLKNSDGNRLSMHIGRMNLTEFYYDILPVLRKNIKIFEEDENACDEILPPEAEFTFYLDAENGIPSCDAEVRYGDVSYPLTDWFQKETNIVYSRDEIREVSAVKQVCEFFPNVSPSEKKFVATDDPEKVYTVMTDGVDRLCSLGHVMSTAAFDSIKVRRKVKIRVGVSVDSDLLNLSVSSDDISQEELYALLESYRQKKSYHRLKNGEFVTIDDSIAELGIMVDSLHLSPKEFIRGNMNVPAYRALYLDRMLENCDDMSVSREWHYRQLIRNFKTVEESDYEIPPSLDGIMRPYQKYGYKWIRTLADCGFGGILADDMGLGKTVQMISVLMAERDEGTIGTSLVVCPASLVYNWIDEFSRFAPDMKVCAVAGNQRERQTIIEKYAAWDVLITSYDILKRDAPLYEDIYFLYEILDEAQYIKTFSTSAAKSVKIIRSHHRLALTGTPIENRLSELWSIFDFLMPGFLYGYETFRTDLEIPITKRRDDDASTLLKKMVSPFILRRIKSEVLKDLPPKEEEIRSVRFLPEQQQLYDARVLHMKEMLTEKSEEELGKSRIQILAELTKIRQICCDPSLLYENYSGPSAKREAAMELIKSAIDGGHKILLFSQFTSMLDLLKKDLDAENIRYYEITGITPKQERLRLVNAFNENNVPLFLISLKAGGTGLNLIGADIVIHYDPWWNAAAQNQATDRAHRIGQTKNVTVFKLIAKNSIEEKIQKMQEAKLSLADEIISGNSMSLGTLTRDELLELFE